MIKPLLGLSLTALIFSACTKDHDPLPTAKTITIENVLDSKPLVESGTFKGDGTADQFPGAHYAGQPRKHAPERKQSHRPGSKPE